MADDKAKETKAPIAKPDDLAKPKDSTAKVELSEAELDRVSGGYRTVDGESTDDKHKG